MADRTDSTPQEFDRDRILFYLGVFGALLWFGLFVLRVTTVLQATIAYQDLALLGAIAAALLGIDFGLPGSPGAGGRP